MAQYIDKSSIKEWLEKRKIPFKKDIDDGVYPTYLCALMDFKDFIDTLEVKEEVFDTNDIKDAFKSGYDMGVLQTTKKMNHNTKEVGLELNSFDATVCKIGNTYLKEMDRNTIVKALEPYKDGDKVKVIIKAQK